MVGGTVRIISVFFPSLFLIQGHTSFFWPMKEISQWKSFFSHGDHIFYLEIMFFKSKILKMAARQNTNYFYF
jgi:hypothetical protein